MTEQQVAFITGTSSGIGLSAAISLAHAGYRVIATMRNTSKSEALLLRAKNEGVELDLQPLDVQDDTAAARAVAYVIDTYGRIDLLVNNAGAGYAGSTEQTSIEELRGVLEVNFIGVWRMTQAVLPHMREAGRGRIITLSSIGGLIGQPFNDAYCAAKFAVEGMMESLAPVVSGLGIQICLIEPGPVLTSFVENVGGLTRQSPSVLMDGPYAQPMKAYMQNITARYSNTGQQPDEVASIIVEAATTEQPHFRYMTSDLVRSRAAAKFDFNGDNAITSMSKLLWSEQS